MRALINLRSMVHWTTSPTTIDLTPPLRRGRSSGPFGLPLHRIRKGRAKGTLALCRNRCCHLWLGRARVFWLFGATPLWR
jgi:hypothetical protein